MKLAWIKPAALGFAVFLLSLVVTIPARWAQQFIPANTPVKLQAVSGTIWRGEAAQFSWDNTSLGQLRWAVKPLSLLTGKLGLDFNLSDSGLRADGTALVYRDQVVVLNDTVASGDIAKLPLGRARLPVELEGRLEAEMKKVVIKASAIHAAEGVINWQSARITAPIILPMGEVALQISGSKGNLKGEFSSQKSAVDTRGTLAFTHNGQFTSDIRLKPNAQTPEDIRELLPALGKSQRDGSVKLHYQGRLRF